MNILAQEVGIIARSWHCLLRYKHRYLEVAFHEEPQTGQAFFYFYSVVSSKLWMGANHGTCWRVVGMRFWLWGEAVGVLTFVIFTYALLKVQYLVSRRHNGYLFGLHVGQGRILSYFLYQFAFHKVRVPQSSLFFIDQDFTYFSGFTAYSRVWHYAEKSTLRYPSLNRILLGSLPLVPIHFKQVLVNFFGVVPRFSIPVPVLLVHLENLLFELVLFSDDLLLWRLVVFDVWIGQRTGFYVRLALSRKLRGVIQPLSFVTPLILLLKVLVIKHKNLLHFMKPVFQLFLFFK